MDDSSLSTPMIRNDDMSLRPRSMSDPGPGPLCTTDKFFEYIKEGIEKMIGHVGFVNRS